MRRPFRRWIAGLTVLVLLAGAGLVVARYEWVPRYRPALRAGERYGIDVSDHQDRIDWPRVAGDRVSFAYIKATEGNDFVDQRFAANWAQAGAAGISRGAYHFFTLCSSGAAQAANFLHELPADPGTLAPAVDLEFSSGCTSRPDRAQVRAQLDAFIALVEQKVGRAVVIYASPAFTQRYPINDALHRDSWRRRLFRRPSAGSWVVWQASDRARVPGVPVPVDLDVSQAF